MYGMITLVKCHCFIITWQQTETNRNAVNSAVNRNVACVINNCNNSSC